MRVLFTAAGSIGSRHIKNLSIVCRENNIPLEIDVIRNSDRILTDDVSILIHDELRKPFELKSYDVAFITSETKLHFDEIIELKKNCRHMFIEKPIFDDVDYDINSIFPDENSEYYVACPIRFSKYFENTLKQVNENEVFSARMIFSSYMPNWQKGRDYRKSFRCYTNRGGGVDIDSLHEVDMMTALFGFPNRVLRIADKYSNLEMDAPDLSVFIFEYDNKTVEMHLDYFGRVNNRRTELFCKDDVITIDYNKRTVIKQLVDTICEYDSDDQFYINEMRYFIKLINSNGTINNINPVKKAFANLKLAKGYSLTEEEKNELF